MRVSRLVEDVPQPPKASLISTDPLEVLDGRLPLEVLVNRENLSGIQEQGKHGTETALIMPRNGYVTK